MKQRKTTQAKKLARILDLGQLIKVPYDNLKNEIKEQYNKEDFYSRYTIEEELKNLEEKQKNQLVCFEFIPHSEDVGFISVRQFSHNPYSLINLLFDCIKK